MEIMLEEIPGFLQSRDKFYILTHQYPDGDTLGSACALAIALQKIGKKVKVLCNDKIPPKYDMLFEGVMSQNFEPECIVSVDVADVQLLGSKLEKFATKIELSIDHHASNKKFAMYQYTEPGSAATAEIIYNILKIMKIEIDIPLATCIYTGISTDTGCFRYANATPRSYRIAADMLEKGIDACKINRIMFDMKSRERLEIERKVLDSMEFFYDNKCAIIHVTQEMMQKANATDSDVEGLASIPRQIEGVLVGVTIREKKDGSFKISVRTDEEINASLICEKFEGGGHLCAAGCSMTGSLQEIKESIVDAIKDFILD